MIIGFVGFAGSGKNTAGEILIGNGFVPISFASAVKDIVSVMFGWPRNLLEGDTSESRYFRETPDRFWSEKFGRPFTPREAMQKIGTEAGRQLFHPDLWILTLEKRLRPNENYVITDVRFPNEIEWITSLGGKVFEIKRGENPEWYENLTKMSEKNFIDKHLFMNKFDVHESEWAWVGHKGIDSIMENYDTYFNLQEKIFNCLCLKDLHLH